MSQEISPLERTGSAVGFPNIEESVRIWRDKYVSLIEREMCLGFALLEKNLLELVQGNLKLILLGRAKTFRSSVLQPAVQEWFDAVVLPILSDANREFDYILRKYEALETEDLDLSLATLIGAPMLASVGGIAVCVAGAYFGIGTKTTLFFWTYLTITNPAVLITSALVGSALMITGIAKLAYVKERLAKLFSKSVIPKLRAAMIGNGQVVNGVRVESLRRQLQISIEERAQQLIDEIEGRRSRANDTV